MTTVLSSLAALGAPSTTNASRRGAGDSSDAFGRSLATAHEEAAAAAGSPLSPGGHDASPSAEPGSAAPLPDGVPQPVLPGLPGIVVDEGGADGLLEGLEPVLPADGQGAGSDPEADKGEGSGVEDGVLLDGSWPVVLPAAAGAGPGSVSEAGVGAQPGTAVGAAGRASVVGLSPAGSEEQASAPVPPTGSAASAAQGAQQAAAGSVAALGASSGAPTGAGAQGATGASAAPPAPVVGGLQPLAAGQAPGGGAGGSPGGDQPQTGDPMLLAQAVSRASDAPAQSSGIATPTVTAPEPTALPAQALPAPAPITQTPVSAAVGQAVPAAPVPQAAPAFSAQVAGPVFQLVGAADGDHVMTLSVTPENLGPVTVRAHIAGGELRIELFAPHDAGRDALRAIATELRRDLAGIAPTASLSVSNSAEAPAHGAPGDGFGRGEGREGAPLPGGEQRRGGPGQPGLATDQTHQSTVDETTSGAARRLDVLV
ncbi:flagellar hook-length control protein FliK [Oerskovia turbata]